MRSFSWPSADQSRCASSISLSDFEIHTALRRPRSQLSRMMPAACRPLPLPVPSPRKKPLRNCTAFSSPSLASAEIVEAFVDVVAAREQFGVGFARIDDGLDLRIGQKAGFNQTFRQQGPVGGKRRSHRGHGGRLHELRRVRLRAGNRDRLHLIGFIKPVAELRIGRGFARLIADFVRVRRYRRRGRKGRAELLAWLSCRDDGGSRGRFRDGRKGGKGRPRRKLRLDQRQQLGEAGGVAGRDKRGQPRVIRSMTVRRVSMLVPWRA